MNIRHLLHIYDWFVFWYLYGFLYEIYDSVHLNSISRVVCKRILSAQPKEDFSFKYGLEDTVKSPTLFYNIDYARNYESHGGLNHKASNLYPIRVRQGFWRQRVRAGIYGYLFCSFYSLLDGLAKSLRNLIVFYCSKTYYYLIYLVYGVSYFDLTYLSNRFSNYQFIFRCWQSKLLWAQVDVSL